MTELKSPTSELVDDGLPTVSVVVPVYQGQAVIADCIKSLLALDYPKQLLEIIVVDNGSNDRTVEIVKGFDVRCLSESKRGAACARNAGIRAARHELVAFTDADCLVDPLWLRALIPAFDNTQFAGCGGMLEADTPQSVWEEYIIMRQVLTQENAMSNDLTSPPFLVTANAIYRKSVLDEVGGFDESFDINGEDADLAWRIRYHFYQIRYMPEGIVYHRHRSTLWSLLKQVRSYGVGSAVLFARHQKRMGVHGFIEKKRWYLLRSAFLRIPGGLIQGNTKLEKLASLIDFLCQIAFLTGKVSASLRLGVRFY